MNRWTPCATSRDLGDAGGVRLIRNRGLRPRIIKPPSSNPNVPPNSTCGAFMEPLDVLAVVAHPDDAELICGGSLHPERRCRPSDRDPGPDPGRNRKPGHPRAPAREAERASELLGLAMRRNAGPPDSRLQNTPETRETVAGFLRETQAPGGHHALALRAASRPPGEPRNWSTTRPSWRG